MFWNFLKPKRPDWAIRSAIAGGASLVIYLGVTWFKPWSPGRFWGLTFGTCASVLFLIDGLYPLRRRLLGWSFGTAQRWLQFHIYGGLLACLFVLIHIGFRAPGGQFGWWLLLLTLWSTMSGSLGVLLQKWLPTVLAGQLLVEGLYERIPELAARLQGEADQVMSGASEMFERVYFSDVRGSLAAVSPSWSYLVDISGGRESRLAPLKNVAQFLDEAEKLKLHDLQSIVTEKLELDAQYSLQRILRLWLLLHVPPSMLLLGLVVAHIVSVWYF